MRFLFQPLGDVVKPSIQAVAATVKHVDFFKQKHL